MSHFDFPRINFYGHCLLDPATANNGFYVPLVIYDPLNVRAVVPPRVYLTEETLKKDVTVDEILARLPKGTEVHTDAGGHLAGQNYIEIEPINTPDIFGNWAIVPLGQFEADKAYLPLYENVLVPNTQESLVGTHPGYWNYYGKQRVSFDWDNGSYLEHVEVSSIAAGMTGDGEQLYVQGDTECPSDIAGILGATVTLNEILGDPNTYTAVMTDLDPTFALYTQIFNDSFGVFAGDEKLLKGKPYKFSMRFPNVFRVVNEIMPNSGSGDFISAIPLDAIDDPDSSAVIKLMRDHGDPDRSADLQGLFIRFNMLEVQENRPPDYSKIGKGSNVARVTVAGSIGPWYRGELRSLVMGRQLIPDQPFLKVIDPKTNQVKSQSMLAPCVLLHNNRKGIVTIDALNILPLFNEGHKDPKSSPPAQSNPVYNTYSLGMLDLKLRAPDGSLKVLASREVNDAKTPRDPFLRSGGMLHFECNMSDTEMAAGSLELHGKDNNGNAVRLMTEAEYMINTDEAGLYANQGDDPAQGYVSYGYPKSHCRLRIYHRGAPVADPVPICIQENMVTAHGGAQGTRILRNTFYKDGDIITFPTRDAANAMYLIQYGHNYSPYSVEKMQGLIIATGSFVSTRILPQQDYGKYLDPNHPDYTEDVPWEVIQEEIFDTIKMIYPAMNDKVPLNGENWDNGYMAGLMVSRVEEAKWDSFHYMPPTRDLSDMQRLLIYKWAEKKGTTIPSDHDVDATAEPPDFTHLTNNYTR